MAQSFPQAREIRQGCDIRPKEARLHSEGFSVAGGPSSGGALSSGGSPPSGNPNSGYPTSGNPTTARPTTTGATHGRTPPPAQVNPTIPRPLPPVLAVMEPKLRVQYPHFKGKRHEDPDLHLAAFENAMLRDPDIMYQIQNMKQGERESIKEYLTRFRLMLRRLEVTPTDAQKITWLRNAVHQRFINPVEDRGYINADDFEDKLRTCAYSMSFRDGAFNNERDAYRRSDQNSEEEQSDDSTGTKRKKRQARDQKSKQKLVDQWKKALSALGKQRAQSTSPAPIRFCHICNNNSHDTRVCYYNSKNTNRPKKDVNVNVINNEEASKREDNRRSYPRRNGGEGSSQNQTSQYECYYCYDKGHIKKNYPLFKKHNDERRTSKIPHVTGNNAIYVELKRNASVSVMTREMRKRTEEPVVVPDSIPEDELPPLRRWDKEDEITKDTIDFIKEMQTTDEQEEVDVGEEAENPFIFTNIEEPDAEDHPEETSVPKNGFKRNRRRKTDEVTPSSEKRVRFSQTTSTSQVVEKATRKDSEGNNPEGNPEVPISSITPWMDIGPVVQVMVKGMMLSNILIDGGSGANVISAELYSKLKGVPLHPAPFNLKMVDQRRVLPMGMVKRLPIRIKTMYFFIDAVVLPASQTKGSVPMILGRPWLRQNYVKQEWALEKYFVELMWKEERRRISTRPMCIPDKASLQHVEVCLLNWEEGLTDEEKAMLQWASPTLWTIAEIDIVPLVKLKDRTTKVEVPDKKNVRFKDNKATVDKEEGEEFKYPKTFSWKRTVVEIEDPSRAARWLQTAPASETVKEKCIVIPLHLKRPYRMNPNYAETVRKEIEKLREADFIYPVKEYEWLSSVVIVPKKNGKLRVCVDYRKLNEHTVKDPYPIPFIDDILDKVAGKDAYTFMDGYSGYNQVSIADEDQRKTAFITPWGAYAYARMPFGLSNAPATFQRLVIDMFADYIGEFMEAFLDDFTVYGDA
ncbi:hypothetical protein R1sor_022964 [Riccia sorocarpa]|uniref:Reverse transcriptase domain-containing protein n=1 Tax=Riccia sorocarpa TaxID=122646 RepID=A0ABD3GLE5_9MARC